MEQKYWSLTHCPSKVTALYNVTLTCAVLTAVLFSCGLTKAHTAAEPYFERPGGFSCFIREAFITLCSASDWEKKNVKMEIWKAFTSIWYLSRKMNNTIVRRNIIAKRNDFGWRHWKHLSKAQITPKYFYICKEKISEHSRIYLPLHWLHWKVVIII